MHAMKVLKGKILKGAETVLLALLLACSVMTMAMAAHWTERGPASMRLIAGGQQADGSYLAGLMVRIRPGWKMYWRSPGEAGVPPFFDWSGSDNLQQAQVRWPLPMRFTLYDLQTYGYHDEVILPVYVRPRRSDAPVSLQLKADLAICSEICVPISFSDRLRLQPGQAVEGIIRDYVARVPRLVDAQALPVRARIVEKAQASILTVDIEGAEGFDAPDLIVETGPGDALSAPELIRPSPGRLRFRYRLDAGASKWLLGEDLTVILYQGRRALERRQVPIEKG